MTPDRPTRREPQSHEAERFVLDYESPVIQYEHLHRYVLAARCVRDLRVLDLASGSGYGSRILRAAGGRVVALDLERESARRASPAVCGDALKLPFADASFDAVVCFEAVEHVADPVAVLGEIDRVLSKQGVAIVSTPDREIYSDRVGNRNPYHIAEMTRREFSERLAARFAWTRLHGQSVWAGSWIARLDADGQTEAAERRQVELLVQPDEFGHDDAPSAPWAAPEDARIPTPLYLVAFCARTKKRGEALHAQIGEESLFHDPTQWLTGSYLETERFFGERVRRLEEHTGNLEARAKEREEVLAGVRAHAANLEQTLAEERKRTTGRAEHAANVENELGRAGEYVGTLKEHIANLERTLEERSTRAADLETHVRNLEGLLEERSSHAEGLEAHVRNLEASLLERTSRIEGLETHARNLEANLEERTAHAEGLGEHAGNLEERIRALEGVIQTRSTEVANRDSQISDLHAQLADAEDKLAFLREQSFEARRELKNIQSALWYRALRRAGIIS